MKRHKRKIAAAIALSLAMLFAAPAFVPDGSAFASVEAMANEKKDGAAKFSVSSKNVSVYKGSKVTVSVKYTGGGKVSYNVSDKSVAKCSWGDWDGDTVPLVIKGKKAGSTTVTLTNSTMSKTIKIKVNVKKGAVISVPDVTSAVEITHTTSGGYIDTKCSVTDVSCSVKKSSGKGYYYEIKIDGRKLYDVQGQYAYNKCAIGYNLIKNGEVVETGYIMTPNIAVGDYFTGSYASGYISAGSYELVLFSGTY